MQRSCTALMHPPLPLLASPHILVASTIDQIIVPRESQWFGFFKPNSTTEIVPLHQAPVDTAVNPTLPMPPSTLRSYHPSQVASTVDHIIVPQESQ